MCLFHSIKIRRLATAQANKLLKYTSDSYLATFYSVFLLITLVLSFNLRYKHSFKYNFPGIFLLYDNKH